MNEQLELLRRGLRGPAYPEYPAFANRLFSDITYMSYSPDNRLIVPDGPWTINQHSNRKDTEAVPPPEKQTELAAQGFQLDSLGRPLHPWFEQMVSDPQIGIVTGKGAYWSWGPNRTADPVVIHDGDILLIKRGDTGNWALPGGFIDRLETAEQAARRETLEETGIIIPEDTPTIRLYEGPVVDLRVTANAWPSTTAVLFYLQPGTIKNKPRAGDDAVKAKWVNLQELQDNNKLFGSHRYLVDLALKAWTSDETYYG